MVETENMADILQAFIGMSSQKRVTYEDVIGAWETVQPPEQRPEKRMLSLEQMMFSATKGDQYARSNLGRILNEENTQNPDERERLIARFRFGVGGTALETYKNVGITGILGLSDMLGAAERVAGYKSAQAVAGAFGNQGNPTILCNIPNFGIHGLPVEFRVAAGKREGEETKPLGYNRTEVRNVYVNLADFLGHIAYRQGMTDLFMARAKNNYIAKVVGMSAQVFAEKLTDTEIKDGKEVYLIDPKGKPAPEKVYLDKMTYAHWQTGNGRTMTGFPDLSELTGRLAFGSTSLLNVLMDSAIFAQSVIGGTQPESQRNEFIYYYEHYNKVSMQALPDANLTVIFGGFLSRYAEKGFGYLVKPKNLAKLSARRELTEQELEEKAKSLTLQAEAFEDIFLFRPQEGPADIDESMFVTREPFKRGGRSVEDFLDAQQRNNKTFNIKHLRSPDLWEARSELYKRMDWSGVDFVKLYEKMLLNSGEQATRVTDLVNHHMEGLTGPDAFTKFIALAAKKGVAGFDWSQFNDREFNDISRYGEKVQESTKALVEAVNAMSGMTGTLEDKIEQAYKNKQQQLDAYQDKNMEEVKKGIEVLVKASEGPLLAYTDKENVGPFMVNFFNGIIRHHMVPPITDDSHYFIDIDWDKFKESGGTTVRPRRITQEGLKKRFLNELVEIRKKELRVRELSTDEINRIKASVDKNILPNHYRELAKLGCRWVEIKDDKGNVIEKDTYLIGSSGRPLLETTTTKEQYAKMGEKLDEMKKDYQKLGAQDKRVQVDRTIFNSIVREYNAIEGNGHNKFNLGWVLGQTPYSTTELIALIEAQEDGRLISNGEKRHLIEHVRRLAKENLIGATSRSAFRDRSDNGRGIISFAPPSKIHARDYSLYAHAMA